MHLVGKPVGCRVGLVVGGGVAAVLDAEVLAVPDAVELGQTCSQHVPAQVL